MKYKKLLTVFMTVIVVFCMTIPAFASFETPDTYIGNGYIAGWNSNPSSTTTTSTTTTPSGGTSAAGASSGHSGGTTPEGYYGAGTSTSPSSRTSGGTTTPTSSTAGGGTTSGTPTTGEGSFSGGSSGNAFLQVSGSGNSVSLSIPTATKVASGDIAGATGLVVKQYKEIGTVILGVCVITAFICLLWQITKLGMAGSDQRSRSMALKGILFSGAAIAIFGSLSLVAGMFWGAFAQ